jgi:toxin ParE1/3/4
MAYLVRLMDRALRDLDHIYREIEADNSRAAHRWFNGLAAKIQSLESQPLRGHLTTDSETHRQLLCGRGRNVYRIIYQIDVRRGAVNVVHIRHGARQKFDPDQED